MNDTRELSYDEFVVTVWCWRREGGILSVVLCKVECGRITADGRLVAVLPVRQSQLDSHSNITLSCC